MRVARSPESTARGTAILSERRLFTTPGNKKYIYEIWMCDLTVQWEMCEINGWQCLCIFLLVELKIARIRCGHNLEMKAILCEQHPVFVRREKGRHSHRYCVKKLVCLYLGNLLHHTPFYGLNFISSSPFRLRMPIKWNWFFNSMLLRRTRLYTIFYFFRVQEGSPFLFFFLFSVILFRRIFI